ncbi:RNA polymerase sigma factor [Streptomyces sp. bgisy159]|uniref:RNA polymerase sigma factor n=1 Tax=Streptomyces sp. bgisy159 TaxID=3413795 RepID=UPI003F4A5E23
MSDAGARYDGFFADHYDELVVMATHMTAGDLHLAEELVADAFVRALRAWDRIDSPRSWLVAVIARDAVKRSRRLRGRLPKPARIWATDRTVVADDPATVVERLEDCARVMRALAELSDRQRTIAVLHWCQDRSQKEIAAMLGVAPSTVARHLARAQRTLRRVFGPRGEALNLFTDLGKERT